MDSMALANYLAGLDREQRAHRGLYADRGTGRRGADCHGLRSGGDAPKAMLGGPGAQEFTPRN